MLPSDFCYFVLILISIDNCNTEVVSPIPPVNRKGLSHDDHAQLLNIMKPSLTQPNQLPKKAVVALTLTDPTKKLKDSPNPIKKHYLTDPAKHYLTDPENQIKKKHYLTDPAKHYLTDPENQTKKKHYLTDPAKHYLTDPENQIKKKHYLTDPAKHYLTDPENQVKKKHYLTDPAKHYLTDPENQIKKKHYLTDPAKHYLTNPAEKKDQQPGPESLSETGKVIHKKNHLAHKIASKLLQVAKPNAGSKTKQNKLHKVVDDEKSDDDSHTELDKLFMKYKHQNIGFKQSVIADHWPLGVIPYRIDTDSYDNILASRVRDQMDELEGVSCLQFKRIVSFPSPGISENRTWIHFTNPKKQRECSHVPIFTESGEVQVILGLDCLKSRDLIHTLLHAIGFNDEVTHPHRAQFIRILWDNIQPKYRKLFAMSTSSKFIAEYDPMSVMHFHDRAFSKNGQATIAPVVPGLQVKPSHKLSQLDKMKLRLAFGHECNRRRVDEIMDTCKNVLHEEAKKEEKAVEGVESDDDKLLYVAENDEDNGKTPIDGEDDGKDDDGKTPIDGEDDGKDNDGKTHIDGEDDGKDDDKKTPIDGENDEKKDEEKKPPIDAENDEKKDEEDKPPIVVNVTQSPSPESDVEISGAPTPVINKKRY